MGFRERVFPDVFWRGVRGVYTLKLQTGFRSELLWVLQVLFFAFGGFCPTWSQGAGRVAGVVGLGRAFEALKTCLLKLRV